MLSDLVWCFLCPLGTVPAYNISPMDLVRRADSFIVNPEFLMMYISNPVEFIRGEGISHAHAVPRFGCIRRHGMAPTWFDLIFKSD